MLFDRITLSKHSGGGSQVEFVVFDLETTGLSAEFDEIIEIGAVLVRDGAIVDTFQSLVKPSRQVPASILELTNTTLEMYENAPTIEEVLPRFLQFIQGKPLCGHHVSFDIAFLQKACDQTGYELPTSVDALDTLHLARVLFPTRRSYSLSDLTEAFQIPVTQYHRAYDDAVSTVHILASLSNRALELPYLTLQQLTRLASVFSSVTAAWYGHIAEERFRLFGNQLPDDTDSLHQLVFSAPEYGDERRADEDREDDSDVTSDEHSANGRKGNQRALSNKDVLAQSSDLLGARSPLKQVMPGFEVREGQKLMVEAVSRALQEDAHLVVEAGTGTGKSLAYLIPAALYAIQHDTRVVVSTHTIALQDQIKERDFPVLKNVIGQPLTLTVFKGRTHYVCMRKLVQEIRSVGFGTERDEVEAYMSFLVWLIETPEGNREELSLRGKSSEIWPRIQSETETCINKRCPFFKPCYYFRARSKAYEADVIVTNHSLVFSDLKADHRVLPRYEKLVLDEAHHIEDQATKHLGSEVHQLRCLALVGRLVRDGGKHGVVPELIAKLSGTDTPASMALPALHRLLDQLSELRRLIDEVFKILSKLIPSGQAEFRFTKELEHSTAWGEYRKCVQEMMALFQEINESRTDIEDAAERETDTELSGRMFDATGFLNELEGQVMTLDQATELTDDWVVWLEQVWVGERKHLSLYRAPIDVSSILRDSLFAKKETVVLTSATLSVDNKFDHIVYRLGLAASRDDGRLETLIVPSPFDYSKQALLCVPNDVPELAKMEPREAATWLSDSIYQLAKASGGRLLALFTSHAMLKATAELLREPLASKQLHLFAQGIDGSRTRILEAFRAHPNSVLLGAQSFWEGIDLPGDQLTTLVIVRLPFTPPTHPVTAARHERIESSGKSAFYTSSLPEAVVRFRQGFGRLIRTVNDRGVVVVYDKRIVTSRYGSSFIKSLSGVRPFVAKEREVLERVEQFLGNPTRSVQT
jgi:ATP-dependent DNA helicase DinG